MTNRPWQTEFTRIFYASARGFTPFRSVPYELSRPGTVFSDTGLEIGDVFRRDRSGDIEYLGLNVAKPAEDPRNSATRLLGEGFERSRLMDLEGFEHVELEAGVDYTVDRNRFAGPCVFSGTNDADRPMVSTPIDDPNSSLQQLRFSSNATEAAYYCLPFGGTSYQCTPSGLEKLRQSALKYGQSWYKRLCNIYDIPNGEICVVTACYKAPLCHSGFYMSMSKSNECQFISKQVVPPVNDDTIGHVDMLQHIDGEKSTPMLKEWGVYPLHFEKKTMSATLRDERYCVMVRGFRVSLDFSDYNECRLAEFDWKKVWANLPKRIRPHVKAWPVQNQSLPPYHPCTSISDLIHTTTRKARVAVVHDLDVLSVLKEKELVLPTDSEIARRMVSKYVLLVDQAPVLDGSGRLTAKDEIHLTRTERCRDVLLKARGLVFGRRF